MRKIVTILTLSFVVFTGNSQTFDELLTKGDEFYMSAKYEEAVIGFSKAIVKDKNQTKGFWYRGDAYFKLLKYEDAIKDYTSAMALDPKASNFYRKRASCYYYTGKYDLSEKDYSKAIQIEPLNSEFYLFRADVYIKLGDKEKTCTDYKSAFDLGEKGAKTTAKNFGCDWAVSAMDKPCSSELPKTDKIEIDPFTGAVFISKGMAFDKFEIKQKGELGFITSAEFALESSIVFKLIDPTNFCEDSEGNVFFGTGFYVFDSKGNNMGGTDDIYGENAQGYPAEYVKSLSATITISGFEIDGDYIVKFRYFDKRGKGEVLVNLPFTVKEKTAKNSQILSNFSTHGAGVVSMAVLTEIEKLEFEDSNKKNVLSESLKTNSTYNLKLSSIKTCGSAIDFTLKIINDKGEEVANQTGTKYLDSPNTSIPFSTEKLASGNYTFWLKINDRTGKCIGFSIPVSISNN